MHPLRAWLKSARHSQGWLAEQLEISSRTLVRLLNGERRWHLDLALQACELTGGAVKPHDLLPPAKQTQRAA